MWQFSPKLIRGARFQNVQELDRAHCTHAFAQVIDLEEGWVRLFGGYDEQKNCWDRGIHFIRIRMSNVFAPTLFQCQSVIVNVMLTAGSTFVHCRRGCDRTGFVCALYRVLVDGWKIERAWEEAKGCGMWWGYQWAWKRAFVKTCLELENNVEWQKLWKIGRR